MSEPEKKAEPAPASTAAQASTAAAGDKDTAAAGTGKKACKDERSCAAEEFAAMVSSPTKILEKIQDKGIDLVNTGVQKVVGAITDQGKCVQLVVNDLPSIAGTIITGIGNSASGALDKITNSIKNLFAELGDREIKGYPNLFGPFETIYAIIIINIQNIINKIALGENANQILADPNMDSKKLFEKMMRTSGRYNDAVKEAKFQGLFKEWISNYISALLKTLEIAQPEIDRINAKIKEIITGMGSNIGKSISHSLLNIIKGIVFNIPVVGGIVSVILSADELGQEIIKTCTPPITKGAGIIMPIVNGINNQINKTKCAGEDLINKLQPIINAAPAAGGALEPAPAAPAALVPAALVQKGGKAVKDKNTRKKINNSTKRLRFLLSRFGTRRRRRH